MIHIEEFTGSDESDDEKDDAEERQPVTMDDVIEACTVLILHMMDMGANDGNFNIKSDKGGRAVISIKIIDPGSDSDKPEGST